jgi:RNA polymerase sigma-70 factor (ECF subfamily)
LEPDELARLMAEVRPLPHPHCTCVVGGSAFEGENIVQEALADAVTALPAAGEILRLESWLFRIAQNAALDALRRRKRHGFAEPGRRTGQKARWARA